jgi:hypothetical protein
MFRSVEYTLVKNVALDLQAFQDQMPWFLPLEGMFIHPINVWAKRFP